MAKTGTQVQAPRQRGELDDVLTELTSIRAHLVTEPVVLKPLLDAVHPVYRDSARNLLHYLALRRQDIRPLQLRLAAAGLSSLGRAESSVLATVDAVIEVLHRLTGRPRRGVPVEGADVDFAKGQSLLAEHSEALLGPPEPSRAVRIMVTMPGAAAHEYSLVHDLLRDGMNCMRINCAHDDPATWTAMIGNLRRAEDALGRRCRVVMDLPGPKLRTGPLEPGPRVVRVRPARDALGRVTAPARLWLAPSAVPPSALADACIPAPENWVATLGIGEKVHLVDARGKQRTLTVVDVTPDGVWAEIFHSIYVVPGCSLSHLHAAKGAASDAVVGELPSTTNSLRLDVGDLLIVTRDLKPGRPATVGGDGRILTPARIGCTIPEAFAHAKTGEAIWFDDGKIGGVIEKVEDDRVLVRITQVRFGGAKLLADKGINLPDTELRIAAITDEDIEDLAFAAEHADVVEMSFASSARDVEQLQEHLRRLGSRRPAIVLKIETRRGLDNLSDMLLTAMRWPCCGVMIARGDLAVECGFERLAEVQEEILWICEAAHVPVIWATQVLETLAKEGMPSRAEITDAAMGNRAECVMLNKGPHVVSAVQTLDNILRRMETHHAKKRAMLRELRLAHALPADFAARAPEDRRAGNAGAGELSQIDFGQA